VPYATCTTAGRRQEQLGSARKGFPGCNHQERMIEQQLLPTQSLGGFVQETSNAAGRWGLSGVGNVYACAAP
jgi:hypothetical protein